MKCVSWIIAWSTGRQGAAVSVRDMTACQLSFDMPRTTVYALCAHFTCLRNALSLLFHRIVIFCRFANNFAPSSHTDIHKTAQKCSIYGSKTRSSFCCTFIRIYQKTFYINTIQQQQQQQIKYKDKKYSINCHKTRQEAVCIYNSKRCVCTAAARAKRSIGITRGCEAQVVRAPSPPPTPRLTIRGSSALTALRQQASEL